MPKTEIAIPTYCCSLCGYSQDFEPTEANMQRHFNDDRHFPLSDLSHYECPSCGMNGSRGKSMIKETDPAKKCKIVILAEEDVDSMQVRSGQFTSEVKRIKTGNFIGAQEIEEEVTERVPVMRNLTPQEKAAKKQEIKDAIAYWRSREDK